jgi:hypothetical protein
MYNRDNYLAASREMEAEAAKRTASEKSFIGPDGKERIRKWKVGAGGVLERGEPVLVEEKEREATEAQKLGMHVEGIKKEAEKLGIDLTEEDERNLLKLKSKTAKKEETKVQKIARYRDELKFLLTPFIDKTATVGMAALYDDEGAPTPTAMNAIRRAMDLIGKSEAGYELDEIEKKLLPKARDAVSYYEEKISEIMPRRESVGGTKGKLKATDWQRPGSPQTQTLPIGKRQAIPLTR